MSRLQNKHYGTKDKGISVIVKENKPWQALSVVYSGAASADCKLHALIIFILYILAHNTFMHGTSEFLSGSSNFDLKKGGFFTTWV